MSIVISNEERRRIAANRLRPKTFDCQGERRVVPLNNPTTDQLLRSIGLDPAQWWTTLTNAALDQALRDMEARFGREYAREKLLQKLEEYRS